MPKATKKLSASDLHQIIRDNLFSGKYPSDQPMPSVRQLERTYGINKDTINRVLTGLESERLIRRQGRRRFSVQRHKSEERIIAVEHWCNRGEHPFYSGFNSGVLESMLSQQYGVQYFTHVHNNTDAAICGSPVIASLLERNILRGVLFPHFHRPSLDDLKVFRDRGVAVVTLELASQPAAVVMDVEQAAMRAVHYMITLGLAPVGMLYWSKFTCGADVRGFTQAHVFNEMQSSDEYLIDCDDFITDYNDNPEDQEVPFDITQCSRIALVTNAAYQAVRSRIQENKLSRGLYISDEFLALGALRAIREAGLRIPEDVAIVSHSSANNWSFELSGITSMRFHAYGFGAEAGRFIVDMVEERRPIDDRLILQASLIKGGSCGESFEENPVWTGNLDFTLGNGGSR